MARAATGGDFVAGVEVGTEVIWNYCEVFKLPRFVVIAKMDRESASFQRALDAVRQLWGTSPLCRSNCRSARSTTTRE